MQQQFQQPRASIRRTLLAGTAFTGTFIAIIASQSGSALAACSVTSSPNTVTCDTTVTTATANFDAASTTSNDYNQIFNSGGGVTGGVNAGQTVSGQGLWIVAGVIGAPITFTNNGAVVGAGQGLQLSSAGGNITYSGNGSANGTIAGAGGLVISAANAGSITVGTSGAPIAANFSGSSALVTSSGGATDVFLKGGSLTATSGTGAGLSLTSGTGNISAALTGNTTITNASGAANTTLGIKALSFGGAVTITSNANIGSAGAMFEGGIQATGTGAGNVSLSQTGGTIFADTSGLVATNTGAGSVSINTSAGSAINLSSGSGVQAIITGTGAANITTAGTISGANGGVSAAIANVANSSDITVAVNGNVTANATGIVATTTGTGKLHVSVGAGVTVRGTTSVGVGLSGSAANTVTNDGVIIGDIGVFTDAGSTTVTNAGSITGTGGSAVSLGDANNLFVMSGPAATLTGQAVGSGTDTFRFAGAGSNSFDVSQIGLGWALLDKTGSSNWTLTGMSTYAGPVTVNGGTLSVNGNLASASSLTVNAGGTLGGNGTVGSTVINGGTLAPGNSIGLLTVSGSLTFTAASTYMVEVSPASADRVNVTGAATLGGATVSAVFAPGSYVAKQYTILNAGSISGTFAGPVNTSLPSGFKSSLSYDANNVYLDLALAFTPPTGLNVNQQNVAAALTNFFNTTGGIPLVFGSLTPAGLTQASGETATGAQQTTFDAMNLFMGLLTDPFLAGRGDLHSSSGGAAGYAADGSDALAYAGGRKRTGAEREAYAAIARKAPPAQVFESHWSVWAAGFGGSQTSDGNAALGSNTAISRIAGGVAGADYWFSPATVAGFALAGGGTNFSVANGGTGRSDLFQAGAFVRHNAGPAYVTGSLAYGWQDITTDRTVTIVGADHLQARFNANAYSGRLEGGYRFVTPWAGLTPYAAAQFTTFDLPAYAEGVISGSNTFVLSYGSKSVTVTRSEFGLRSDKSFALNDAILTLRGRAAWSHDFNADRNITATFQTLPGASFVINGAAQARDAALTTASAEMKFASGISLAATFEGEFSAVTRSYAGKGVVRYGW